LILIIGISVGTATNISFFLLTDNLPGVLPLILVATIGVIGGLLTLIGLILILVGRRESGGAVRQKSDKSTIDKKRNLLTLSCVIFLGFFSSIHNNLYEILEFILGKSKKFQ